MLTKLEKNIYLNITMLIFGVVCVFTGIALSIKSPAMMSLFRSLNINIKSLHEWSSYILTVFVMLHLVFHFEWIKAMTRNKLSVRKKA